MSPLVLPDSQKRSEYHRTIPSGTPPNRVRPSVSVSVEPAIPITRKVLTACDRLFGAHLPHHAIARLNGFNSLALTKEFKSDVLRVLSDSDPGYYYLDPESVQRVQISRVAELDAEGTILVGWRRFQEKRFEKRPNVFSKNPHHIVPKSRWGTNHPQNLRRIDRGIHDDFHTLFSNLTPIEQSLHLLAVFARDLNPVFVGDFLKILAETDLSYYYRKGVVSRGILAVSA